jgi:hypothetical protein
MMSSIFWSSGLTQGEGLCLPLGIPCHPLDFPEIRPKPRCYPFALAPILKLHFESWLLNFGIPSNSKPSRSRYTPQIADLRSCTSWIHLRQE